MLGLARTRKHLRHHCLRHRPGFVHATLIRRRRQRQHLLRRLLVRRLELLVQLVRLRLVRQLVRRHHVVQTMVRRLRLRLVLQRGLLQLPKRGDTAGASLHRHQRQHLLRRLLVRRLELLVRLVRLRLVRQLVRRHHVIRTMVRRVRLQLVLLRGLLQLLKNAEGASLHRHRRQHLMRRLLVRMRELLVRLVRVVLRGLRLRLVRLRGLQQLLKRDAAGASLHRHQRQHLLRRLLVRMRELLVRLVRLRLVRLVLQGLRLLLLRGDAEEASLRLHGWRVCVVQESGCEWLG